jgi:hypothetical protein
MPPIRISPYGSVSAKTEKPSKDGQWKIGDRRLTVYARKEFSLGQQRAAADALAKRFAISR